MALVRCEKCGRPQGKKVSYPHSHKVVSDANSFVSYVAPAAAVLRCFVYCGQEAGIKCGAPPGDGRFLQPRLIGPGDLTSMNGRENSAKRRWPSSTSTIQIYSRSSSWHVATLPGGSSARTPVPGTQSSGCQAPDNGVDP
jgi:hypothetical protein